MVHLQKLKPAFEYRITSTSKNQIKSKGILRDLRVPGNITNNDKRRSKFHYIFLSLILTIYIYTGTIHQIRSSQTRATVTVEMQ
jgi:hypothetical protein